MTFQIQRVAVLGAGVMGSGIAAHLANAGIDSLLFDMVPKDAGTDPKKRNAFALKGVETAQTIKPAALFKPDFASRIKPCNYDDHAELLKTCDWIIEVVVERLDIKQKIFQWVDANRRADAIVSSNTSGIKLADMAATMTPELRSRFLVTHFFNPVRYMKLLELVPGPETKAEVVEAIATFGANVLGKGIVYGKDTPNFIANRIGTYGMASVFGHMQRLGMSVEEIDAIFGGAMGRPNSAVFRTADLVGLDTLGHVFANVYDNAPNDEARNAFVIPDFVTTLVKDGRTGEKAGAGFFKKIKNAEGKSEILFLDVVTGEYKPQGKVRFDSIGASKKAEGSAAKVKAMVYGADKAGEIAWSVTADTLIYSANRLIHDATGPEIADDIVNVDNAMKWGFGWDLGPFETWDAIGVRKSVEKMTAEGKKVPQWVQDMLARGQESFYARDGATRKYLTQTGEAVAVPLNSRHIRYDDLRAGGKEVHRNASASLYDLGDGVLGLEFHSKMNALDDLIIAQYGSALDRLDKGEFDALVIANQDPKAFCAGANILMILMGAMQKDWKAIDTQSNALQQLLMRAKYNRKPVVAAPHTLTLGGGCEVSMHTAATVAGGELYMGLVEAGVGLIPGAGGCKELLVRYMGDVPQDIDYDPNPYVQKAFERIALAKVSTSAEEARGMGYLRFTDPVVLDSDALVWRAKQTALGLVKSGWVAPQKRTVKVPGRSGKAAIELFLYQMHEGGFATDHDVTVGKKLAHVLTGGDVPAGTVLTEQNLLDLERESFLSLCGEQKTLDRIQAMLQTGKPLRN